MGSLAAADEMNDLVVVAVGEQSFEPPRARQNFTIAFDGHAAGFEAENPKQIGNGRAGVRGARMSVDGNCDLDGHGFIFA